MNEYLAETVLDIYVRIVFAHLFAAWLEPSRGTRNACNVTRILRKQHFVFERIRF